MDDEPKVALSHDFLSRIFCRYICFNFTLPPPHFQLSGYATDCKLYQKTNFPQYAWYTRLVAIIEQLNSLFKQQIRKYFSAIFYVNSKS